LLVLGAVSRRDANWALPIGATTSKMPTKVTSQRAVRYNFSPEEEAAMNINDKAPGFTLLDENAKEVSLTDFRGKTVVLFFYPKADTPG
jgi:cytochrome oxidase Cu insertion factor (SCO1/SenC/PrrC family)